MNNNYKVIILKTDTSDSIISTFAQLFKIPEEKSRSILQKDSFIIKKETDKATAEKFHKAITAAGVNCRIEEIATDIIEDTLPVIEEIQNTAKVKPLTDITQPDITPLHEESAKLSLEARPDKKTTAATKEAEIIADINPANFCPDCGTIRASADSICVHCDYNPGLINKANTRSLVIKSVIGISILAIAILLGLPFYQQFAKNNKIEEDLKLAFDTRNTVTEFIQKTSFWPNQNIDAGLPEDINNQSIQSIIVGESAVITITLRGEILDGRAQTLVFTPNILKGRIVWNCIKGTLQDKFRPEICLQHDIK